MNLEEIKHKLQSLETEIQKENALQFFGDFLTSQGKMNLFLTERLYKKCKKGKVWKSRAMLSTLKNIAYGFDTQKTRSRGGTDGIFIVDRDFKPANSIMRKLFDKFLDKPIPLKEKIVKKWNVPAEEWVPVRLVSHYMRLLGIIVVCDEEASLILVDYDNEKGN